MKICMLCCPIEQAKQLVEDSHRNNTERELLNGMCLEHKPLGETIEKSLKLDAHMNDKFVNN